MNNLTAKDFYKPTKYNPETLNQIWMSEIADSHDIWCDCCGPFAHLLASIFPPGHQDRDKTINQILQRDYKQCLSGGPEERSHGGAGGDIKEEQPQEEREEGFIEDHELENLIDAAEDATKEDTR